MKNKVIPGVFLVSLISLLVYGWFTNNDPLTLLGALSIGVLCIFMQLYA